MAHGWDSYFNIHPPLSPDSGSLRRKSESEGGLSKHIENFTGHHDFAGAEASHEAHATTSNFNTNSYSNPNIENSSSDCVYQSYYTETPWQADGEQMEKEYLPECGNGDISDFATDGLSTSGYGSQTMCLQHEAFCDGVYKEGLSKVKSNAAAKLSSMPIIEEATPKPQAEGLRQLLFKEGSKTTGTAVLQTNVPCKDDSMDRSSQKSKEVQSSSSKEKAVQYQCSECDKSFTDGLLLISHLEDHGREEQEKKRNTCSKCGRGRSNIEEQSIGQVSTTGESDEDENNGSGESDSDSAPYFPCHASQLQQHQRMHKSEFQCQACGRGFVSLFALRKHKHTHGKSRPYRCSNERFRDPEELSEHGCMAAKERPYSCSDCNIIKSVRTCGSSYNVSAPLIDYAGKKTMLTTY
ncbi:hypothetical protein Q8A73_008114 [Channa argus]|nr:hypothetical protein Q8A73_008114 [Channa argus]